MIAVYGKTIAIVPQTVDKYGNRTAGVAVTVPGCVVYDTPGAEAVHGQDTVTYTATVLAPPGTVVEPTDRIIVDGVTFEVVGNPIVWVSPHTGESPGVQINLRVVVG